MAFNLSDFLKSAGLAGTATALESDLATLLAGTTPEGWLARGALAAAGGLGVTSLVKGAFGAKSHKKTHRRTRSRRRYSSKRYTSRKKRYGHRRYRSKAWMAHIRRMRKK